MLAWKIASWVTDSLKTETLLAYQTAGVLLSNLNVLCWSLFKLQYAFVVVNHLRFINIMLPSIDFFFRIILSLYGDVAWCIENGQFALKGCILCMSALCPQKIKFLNGPLKGPESIYLMEWVLFPQGLQCWCILFLQKPCRRGRKPWL